MGNGGCYDCLIESQGVPGWWKETHVFVIAPSLLLNHLKVARNSFHFPQTSFTNSFVNAVWFIVSG